MREALGQFEAAISSHDSAGLLISTERFYQVMLNGCGNHIIAELLQGLRREWGAAHPLDVAPRTGQAQPERK